MRVLAFFVMVCCWCVCGLAHAGHAAQVAPGNAADAAPLRLGVVGLTHGHVEGLLWQSTQRSDLQIVGVYEPDAELFARLARKYAIAPEKHFTDLQAMLAATKPEAVSVMGAIADHRAAVEACAPLGVHMLVEKPLAFDAGDAHAMAALARQHGVHLLTNYETTWYASVREAKRLASEAGLAPVRKMVFRHGHKGPQEIGCNQDFLRWLTDPDKNGGGAVVDFGCYGILLATWLREGERPQRVVATASTLKPSVYPRVDDDATITLVYPDATAVVQASWAWTHDNKEMDLHTEGGSLHAGKWNALTIRKPDQAAQTIDPPALPASTRDEWTYFRSVVRGTCEVDPLTALDMNVIVAEVLDEARAQIAAAKEAHAGAQPADTKPTQTKPAVAQP
jgi:predicted dehydrogenase